MLKIENLDVSYGHITALIDVSLEIPEGKIVSIIGSNGAGKTTLLNTISGIVQPQRGKISFYDESVLIKPHHIVKKGIVHVPEGRKVFSGLTVAENLVVGGFLINKSDALKNEKKMYEHFPRLLERKNQQAGTLSGGEQQMLAIARGLMSNPKLILLDEPSLGLAPVIVKQVFKLIKSIKEMGVTVLLVEQNASKALELADIAYVIENGKIIMSGSGKELLKSDEVKKAYLGEKK